LEEKCEKLEKGLEEKGSEVTLYLVFWKNDPK
jgi:hypothetical protein